MAPKFKTKGPRERVWQEVAKEAQDYRDQSLSPIEPSVPEIPSHLPQIVLDTPDQLLSEEEINITSRLPEEIIDVLASGVVTSAQVCNAFLRRAAVAQKLVNGLQNPHLMNTTLTTTGDKLYYRTYAPASTNLRQRS
jgi:hypothetical protein